MHKFAENHPALNGFSEYFERIILPEVLARESERQNAANKALPRLTALSFFIILTIAGFLFLRTIYAPLAYCVPIFAAVVAFDSYKTDRKIRFSNVTHTTKMKLVDGICGFVGWDYTWFSGDDPDLDVPIMYGLLPGDFDRKSFEDRMSGEVHGVKFETIECLLKKKLPNSDIFKTVFRGSLMALEYKKNALGTTVVLPKSSKFKFPKTMNINSIGLVDPEFNRSFSAYGTDQVEGRYLLSPDIMQRFADLKSAVAGESIRFAFLENRLLITIEGPDKFEAGDMDQPLSNVERTQTFLDEISAIHNLIDGLVKPLAA